MDVHSGSEEPVDERDMNGDMSMSHDDNQSHDNIQSHHDQYAPNVHVIKPINEQGDRGRMSTTTEMRRSSSPETNELTLRNDNQDCEDLTGQADHYHTLHEQDLHQQLSIDGNHVTNTSSSSSPPPQQQSPLEYHATQKDQSVLMHSEMSPELVANQMERLQAIANYSSQGLFPEHFSLPVCVKPEAERATL